jgi:EAL domain-containing protein (putative c-di-GMP-specific phosphodiesterase class I)
VIDLASGGVAAFEALLRWNSAELRSVPPAAFIPVAEETGLIAEIGGWVIDEACRQYAAWSRQHTAMPVVAVNLSPRQLADGGLPATVNAALETHGVPIDGLRFELTETALTDLSTDEGCSPSCCGPARACRSTTSAPATARWRGCGRCACTS